MEYLKVREAALKYQISEKTLRKWITSKQLASTTRVVNGVEQYALLPEDIEKLIAEKSLEARQVQSATSGHMDTPSPESREQITALAAELSYQAEMIDALKQELEALQERVAMLERKSKTTRRVVADVNYSVPPQETEPPGQRVQTQAADKPVSTSTRPDLPEGTITLAQLATELGINRTTLVGHVKNESNHLNHIAIPRQNRPGEYLRYFTPGQQEAAKEWHRGHTRRDTSPTLWEQS